MSSDAITEPGRGPSNSPWGPSRETAPSVLRGDDPTFLRAIGLISAMLVSFGGAVLIFNLMRSGALIGPGVAILIIEMGVAGLLVHAAIDGDLQIRRIYLVFAATAFVVGAALCFMPSSPRIANPFGPGFLLVTLALPFTLASLRHETEPQVRLWTEYALGAVGIVLAAVGLVGGNVKGAFLIPHGLLLAGLGLAYLASFISIRGDSDDLGYYSGMALAGLGLLVFIFALGRSSLPPLFYHLHWIKSRPQDYFLPYGLILVILGLVYAGVGACLYSDRPLFVLTRREMGAIFYSPIFFVLLAASVALNWGSYLMHAITLLDESRATMEPIVLRFIWSLPTVLFTVCYVPALTMRLLSEEKRTGTLEVLLTVPVDETSVVVSKFLAAWVLFLLGWVPLAVDLVLLRIDGGSPFDYYPLLNFFVGLCFTGAAFVSMGLFFSSLSRNQIISGALALAGMIMLTLIYIVGVMAQDLLGESSAWATVLTHLSYLDVWRSLLQGKLEPRLLLSFASMTVLFQYLTVKVLEARRWL
jgi:ABC-2 type transport system permease protein